MGTKPSDDPYNDRETARRRDEVIRRMANTPPQPKVTGLRPKTKKIADADCAAHKDRAPHED